ncbi:MAG: class I SAM-dependent methyltransferase [Proteobacteria bacterium]|nr:class I SAM-dependent methyltransferase [Pseudomonadota bacterium]
MSDFRAHFEDASFVSGYLRHGPPAFMPGHSGVLQMAGVLIRENASPDAHVLVVGAGGGLETRALAQLEPHFRFLGVDPAPRMLELAREVIGPEFSDRVDLLEGTADDAPLGPFDAATCILVLGLLPDDGSKHALLQAIRRRMKPRAPLILVDQCLDKAAADFEARLDRYASYARASGVDPQVVEQARAALAANPGLVASERNETLIEEAGFRDWEVFYVGMAWRGWLALA